MISNAEQEIMEDIYFIEKERRYFDDGRGLMQYGDRIHKIWLDEWAKYKAARKEGKEAVEKYITDIKFKIPGVLKKEEKQWFES